MNVTTLSMPTRHSPLPLLPELLLLLAGIGLYCLLPDDLGFATRVVIGALFALSIDLVLGYAGIVTLGQAALFGTGAYAAGLFALHASADPLLGLLFAAAAGMLVAWVSGWLVIRSQGLTSVMITLAVAQVLLEGVSKARLFTGGDDGLSGIAMQPLFGRFEFDFLGRTGYWYALAVLLVVFALLRRLVQSPFGLTLVGLRQDRGRMVALGCRVQRRLATAYAVGGAVAGLAGGLSAQVTQVVGLSSLSFSQSAEVLVMVVLGGTGRLWGAILGTVAFMGVHHLASAVDPLRWMLVIGILLLVVVLVMPQGLSGGLASLFRKRASHGAGS